MRCENDNFLVRVLAGGGVGCRHKKKNRCLKFRPDFVKKRETLNQFGVMKAFSLNKPRLKHIL